MRLNDTDVPAHTVLEALRSLDQACLTLCEGQYMDLTYQDQLMVAESDYFDMIRRKTGALSGCSAKVGALASAAEPRVADALQMWGEKLGMALQIRGDIADLWGNRGDGFTPSNVLNKKKSLPLIHALQTASTATKRELGGIYMKRVLEPGDSVRIVGMLEETGSREYAEECASKLVQDAEGAVSDVVDDIQRPDVLSFAAQWTLAG